MLSHSWDTRDVERGLREVWRDAEVLIAVSQAVGKTAGFQLPGSWLRSLRVYQDQVSSLFGRNQHSDSSQRRSCWQSDVFGRQEPQ